MRSQSPHSQPAASESPKHDREELLRQLHDVIQGRVRMSASRFIDLVKAVNSRE